MKPIFIGNVKISAPAIFAPMAGFSDVAARYLCYCYGAGLTCTEMISAKALEKNNKKTIDLLATNGESPVAVQLFGSDPQTMANACKNPLLQKFDIIDINMGCPTPKIVKNGDGSALLGDIKKAESIIRACVSATTKPITVKFRIGTDDEHIVAVQFAQMCQRAGASAITVHGRTVKQGYGGKSNLDVIKKVVESVTIPVFASGDAVDKQSFLHILNYTGATGVMIGRAAIGRPEIFAECQDKPFVANKYDQLKTYAQILLKYNSERTIFAKFRGIACHYIKSLPNSAKAKTEICSAKSIEQILQICGNFLNHTSD